MNVVTLEGRHVRLDPLVAEHEQALVAAAADGELWNSIVTVVPTSETMGDYIKTALEAQHRGDELPFVIVQKSPERIVGTTRFYYFRASDRTVDIGYTWLAHSAQRSAVNTEAKLLLLTHAFEELGLNRVELVTDVLNDQSRAAILRLGAKQEGVLRNHLVMPNGRVRDSAIFSIIVSEWPEVKAGLETKLAKW